VLGLITTALDTNMTIDDSSLASCDGDDVSGDFVHLILDFPSPQTQPVCPAPESDDPQCPEVNLPLAWTGGEAQAPAESQQGGTLVTSGFEYYNPLRCTTDAGSFTSIGDMIGDFHSWTCIGFDTRVGIMPSGSGPRGISFQCTGTGRISIGLQQAARGGASPLPSQPDTWDTSTNANFKQLYDEAVINPETCTESSCAGTAFAFAIDAGISCRDGRVYSHYHHVQHEEKIGEYSASTTMSLMVDGTDFKFYHDGQLVMTRTDELDRWGQHQETIGGPLWVVTVSQNPGARLENVQYITAPGTVWEP